MDQPALNPASLHKIQTLLDLRGCPWTLTFLQVLNNSNSCMWLVACSGDSGHTVVICGVQHAARTVGRQRVVILSQNPADDTNQDLPILLPQQTVDKGVSGGLCIRETLGGDAPVPRDVYRGQQLHQPAGGIRAVDVNHWLVLFWGCFRPPVYCQVTGEHNTVKY